MLVWLASRWVFFPQKQFKEKVLWWGKSTFTVFWKKKSNTKEEFTWQLTFSVHGYSNRWFKPFVVHQTFDGHILQQPWLDSQCTYDQGGPVALWELCRHRGAHGTIIPLHVPHYLGWRAWHWGAVGFNHTWRGSLVAHLRFGQHCVESPETARTSIAKHWTCAQTSSHWDRSISSTHMVHLYTIFQHINSFFRLPLFSCAASNAQSKKLWKCYYLMIKQWNLGYSFNLKIC